MILRPWLGQNKPPLGVRPIPGHPLTPVHGYLANEGSGNILTDVVRGKAGSVDLTKTGWGSLGYGVGLRNTTAEVQTPITRLALDGLGNAGDNVWILIRCSSTTNAGNICSFWGGGVTSDAYFNLRPYTTSVQIAFSCAFKSWAFDSTAAGTGPVSGEMADYLLTVNASTCCLYWNGKQVWTAARTAHPGRPTFMGLFNRVAADAPAIGDVEYVAYGDRDLSAADAIALYSHPFQWLGVPDLAAMWAAGQAVPAAGHPALRRLGLFDTGFGFDRSREARWG